MEFAPDRGLPILEEIARGDDLTSLSAEVVLKEWRKGTLRFP
jgi:hypothetical protein